MLILLCILLGMVLISLVINITFLIEKETYHHQIEMKQSLYAFAISIIYFLYNIFVVGNYISSNTIEDCPPTFEGNMGIKYLLIIPAFLIYSIYIYKYFKIKKYFCSATYPFIVINIFVPLMHLIDLQDSIMFLSVVLFLSILIMFIIGIYKDIINI